MQRFVHISTSKVHGVARYVPIDEEHPLQAQSPCAAKRIAADLLAFSLYRFSDALRQVRGFEVEKGRLYLCLGLGLGYELFALAGLLKNNRLPGYLVVVEKDPFMRPWKNIAGRNSVFARSFCACAPPTRRNRITREMDIQATPPKGVDEATDLERRLALTLEQVSAIARLNQLLMESLRAGKDLTGSLM